MLQGPGSGLLAAGQPCVTLLAGNTSNGLRAEPMRRLGISLKMLTAVAAAGLLLLPVLWIPSHTCMTRTVVGAPCLGCLWGILTTFVVSLALTAALLGEGRFRAVLEPAPARFLARPLAFGRGPPSTHS